MVVHFIHINFGDTYMRNLSRVLIAAALSTLTFSTLTVTTWADDGSSVKTGQAPYKPGRQIDESESDRGNNAAQAIPSSDDGTEPVKSGTPPYKPGRQANEDKDGGDSANN